MSRQSQICLFAIATSILNGSTALGIVTSDAEGTHIVSTGQIVPPFGLNLDGVVRVQLLGEDLYTGQPASIWARVQCLQEGNTFSLLRTWLNQFSTRDLFLLSSLIKSSSTTMTTDRLHIATRILVVVVLVAGFKTILHTSHVSFSRGMVSTQDTTWL